jgi:hypothetical protein
MPGPVVWGQRVSALAGRHVENARAFSPWRDDESRGSSEFRSRNTGLINVPGLRVPRSVKEHRYAGYSSTKGMLYVCLVERSPSERGDFAAGFRVDCNNQRRKSSIDDSRPVRVTRGNEMQGLFGD